MSPFVQSFFHAPTCTWSHIVADPATRIAAIIDPVLDYDPASGRVSTEQAQLLLAHIAEHGWNVTWLLETHAHADHLTGAEWLKQQITRSGPATPVRTGPSTGLRTGPSTMLRTGIGAGIVKVQRHFRAVFGLGDNFAADGSQFDHLFADDERIALGNLELRVIATPGHTSDGVSYLVGDAVFVGDTLFAPSAGTGRCDFPGADAATQYRSIQRLYQLPDATRVFLCHDYPAAGVEPVAQTMIAAEKSGNSQLRADTSEADYVAFRARRDATLAVPRLLYPSLQVNICAGQLPQPDAAGRAFIRIPIDAHW